MAGNTASRSSRQVESLSCLCPPTPFRLMTPHWTRRFADLWAMAMLDIKSIHVVKAKGRTYVYAWRGGPRVHSPVGTDAFIKELAEIRDAANAPRQHDPATMASLCALWRGSDHWKTGIGEKTRTNWTPWLDRIQDHFGGMRIAAFDRPLIKVAIRKWRDKYKDTPRSADVALEVLSRLLTFGIDEGKLMSNAVKGMPRLYKSDRSMIIWTTDDIKQLDDSKTSPQMMRAVRLAALTGLRTSDLIRLQWNHIKPLSIEITTGKSLHRKETLIPLYGELRDLLASIPRSPRSLTILNNEDGERWRGGFGSSFQKAKKRAGIDKHFHDLRGTAATRMYVGGLTEREIAEICTWSEDYVAAMIRKYVKKDELLRDRIRRLDEARQGTRSVKLVVKPPA